ncbi:hypothetical protein ACIBEH_13585 [Nocardia salmonicida]|uniref:hypothetical protein n=1 Tax=Nocardia salmonicida TaxID=53431 RepID=UPI0037A112CE
MTSEEQPQTPLSIPAPIASKRPAIEIAIRVDSDQLAELAESGVDIPAENYFAPAVAQDVARALTAAMNSAGVPPDSAPPPDEERYQRMHLMVMLGIAMTLAAVAAVLVDGRASA